VEIVYDIAGRALLQLRGTDEATNRYIAREMDPYRPTESPADAPAVVLSPAGPGELGAPIELQRPAGDGLVTASDAATLRLVADGRTCTVPDVIAEQPAVFRYEPGFPVGHAFKPYVRSALQLAMAHADAACMHAASVEVAEGAVLIAGWSESGKTETALALLEAGARFQSDKWTVVSADGTASAFPIDIGVRGWALRYLPTLRAALPASARRQLQATRFAAAISGYFLRRSPEGRLGQTLVAALRRALALGDRAPVSPSQLRTAYGQDDDPGRPLPLRAVVFLTTDAGDRLVVRPADARRTAGRLARSAAYERRPYFALVERAMFSLPEIPRQDLATATIEREEGLLGGVLEGTQVLEAQAPFPIDPRRIADAVQRWL
jgi:hypothetical protein